MVFQTSGVVYVEVLCLSDIAVFSDVEQLFEGHVRNPDLSQNWHEELRDQGTIESYR